MTKQEEHVHRLRVKLTDFKHNAPALKQIRQWIKDQEYSKYKVSLKKPY